MGINDRDYYRDESGGSLHWHGEAPVCVRLIVANVVVFLAQALITQPVLFEGQVVGHVKLIDEWFALHPADVLRGQVWQLVTYAFLHGGPFHLLFNMFGLYLFGRGMEQIYGSREFFWFYLGGAFFAGLCHLVFGLAIHSAAGAVGASGAVMACAMLYACYYPSDRISVYGFPIEVRWLVTFYVIADAFPVLQALANSGLSRDRVAHAAHLGGLLYGWMFFRFDLRFGKWLTARGWRRIKHSVGAGPQLRVYKEAPPESPNLEQQVDEILAKIHAQGEASLTDEERRLLEEASRRYKNRSSPTRK